MTTSEEGAPGDNADVAEGTCDDRLACDGRVPGRNDAGKNYNAGRSNEYYFYTRAPSRGLRDRPLGCGLHKPRRISSSFFSLIRHSWPLAPALKTVIGSPSP